LAALAPRHAAETRHSDAEQRRQRRVKEDRTPASEPSLPSTPTDRCR
jgi:hypothetical protein